MQREPPWAASSILIHSPHIHRILCIHSLNSAEYTSLHSPGHWYHTHSQSVPSLPAKKANACKTKHQYSNEYTVKWHSQWCNHSIVNFCSEQMIRYVWEIIHTIKRVAPKAMQKITGPVKSVSFMMLPSAGFIGFSTVRVFCQMWSKLMPNSDETHVQ